MSPAFDGLYFLRTVSYTHLDVYKRQIHSLDPRTKLMLMIAYIVIVFLVRSMWMFIPVAVFLAMTIVLARCV